MRDRTQVHVTALPGRHGPGLVQAFLPPVMGSLLEFGPRGVPPLLRLYITGNTLMFPGIKEISRRHPDLHLAVPQLGGTTLPGGLLVTMDARSPLSDFLAEADRGGFAADVVRCGRGEQVQVGLSADDVRRMPW
ncbi:aldehyde:ferredoxin oxidoreductase [Streptomyces fulvorobeus]|uniref:Aldehyde:ferredoxin oxidoreductase n=1 Tax=Streptomyces fulvorobeus TaxID=284028 RepID=A0A7Y9H7F1_9ACTN|nr:aldehyde:ferredoxin oxidoreductase [Streptomyces fulvorobeus]